MLKQHPIKCWWNKPEVAQELQEQLTAALVLTRRGKRRVRLCLVIPTVLCKWLEPCGNDLPKDRQNRYTKVQRHVQSFPYLCLIKIPFSASPGSSGGNHHSRLEAALDGRACVPRTRRNDKLSRTSWTKKRCVFRLHLRPCGHNATYVCLESPAKEHLSSVRSIVSHILPSR